MVLLLLLLLLISADLAYADTYTSSIRKDIKSITGLHCIWCQSSLKLTSHGIGGS